MAFGRRCESWEDSRNGHSSEVVDLKFCNEVDLSYEFNKDSNESKTGLLDRCESQLRNLFVNGYLT